MLCQGAGLICSLTLSELQDEEKVWLEQALAVAHLLRNLGTVEGADAQGYRHWAIWGSEMTRRPDIDCSLHLSLEIKSR